MESQLAQQKVDFVKKAGVYWLPGKLSAASNGYVDHICPLGVASPGPQIAEDVENEMPIIAPLETILGIIYQ